MEQPNHAYKTDEVPPAYSSSPGLIVQQPAAPSYNSDSQNQSLNFALQHPVHLSGSAQRKLDYKKSCGGCDGLSWLVICFCYPFVWSKIAGRVKFWCGSNSRGIWKVIMCLLAYVWHSVENEKKHILVMRKVQLSGLTR